jgi:hypothetical protein
VDEGAVIVNGTPLGKEILRRVARLPGVELATDGPVVTANGETDLEGGRRCEVSRFRFDGGVGLIMPRRHSR